MEEPLRYPELDTEQFWRDNEVAMRDNCFCKDAKQVAFGIDVLDECVITELGLDMHPWSHLPPAEMIEYRKRYNDKAEAIVGKRILKETPKPHVKFPSVRLHGEVFGGTYSVQDHVSWLHSDMKTPEDLEKSLDYADTLLPNLRDFILPANWDSEKKRIFEETGETPDPYWYGRRVRGPVTLAMSLYGIENTIFLMYDEPELTHRFFKTIENVLMAYTKIFEQEAGMDKIQKNRYAYRFNDDNCSMLTADLYEEFAFPVLQHVFDYTCPGNNIYCRYHHSDSEMAHLIPVLSRLNLTAVQFGPTVLLDQIRKHMPDTRVDGCLDPLTLMSNDEEKIIAEVRRDCEMAKTLGTRGLKIDAAGSVNYGTKLTSIRAAMYAVQKYGRY